MADTTCEYLDDDLALLGVFPFDGDFLEIAVFFRESVSRVGMRVRHDCEYWGGKEREKRL